MPILTLSHLRIRALLILVFLALLLYTSVNQMSLFDVELCDRGGCFLCKV